MLVPSTPWHGDCRLWLVAHVGTANTQAKDQRAHKCLFTSPRAPVWPAGNLNPRVLLRGARTATQINTNCPPPGAGQWRRWVPSTEHPLHTAGCSLLFALPLRNLCPVHRPFDPVFQGSVCVHEDNLLFSLAPPGEGRTMHNLLLKAPRKIC